MGFGLKGWKEEMGAENFGNTSAGSKRSAKRARVLLTARIEIDDREVEARLRDLSQKGALLECNEVPPVGSDVVFVRGGTRVPARVAWTGSKRIGLEFVHEIDEHEVFMQIGRQTPPKPVGFPRPGLFRSMSPDDVRAARAWGVTVGLTLPESDS